MEVVTTFSLEIECATHFPDTTFRVDIFHRIGQAKVVINKHL